MNGAAGQGYIFVTNTPTVSRPVCIFKMAGCWKDAIVQVICPTCQNVFARKSSCRRAEFSTLHGVVFDILVWMVVLAMHRMPAAPSRRLGFSHRPGGP
jgi:hypothetical protein